MEPKCVGAALSNYCTIPILSIKKKQNKYTSNVMGIIAHFKKIFSMN